MNVYDDGDTIVVDVVRHPKMFDRDRTSPNEGPATLDRWTVDAHASRSEIHANLGLTATDLVTSISSWIERPTDAYGSQGK